MTEVPTEEKSEERVTKKREREVTTRGLVKREEERKRVILNKLNNKIIIKQSHLNHT